IKGVEVNCYLRRPTVLEKLKGRTTLVVERHYLAIDGEIPGNRFESFGDAGEPSIEHILVAGKHFNIVVVFYREAAISVELDLECPIPLIGQRCHRLALHQLHETRRDSLRARGTSAGRKFSTSPRQARVSNRRAESLEPRHRRECFLSVERPDCLLCCRARRF